MPQRSIIVCSKCQRVIDSGRYFLLRPSPIGMLVEHLNCQIDEGREVTCDKIITPTGDELRLAWEGSR